MNTKPVRYAEAHSIGDQGNRILVRTDELRPVKDAFSSNFERIAGLCMFPVCMASIFEELTRAGIRATHAVTGRAHPTQDEITARKEEITDKASHLFRDMTVEKEHRFMATFGLMDHFISFGESVCEEGAVDVFKSLIVQAWTAFEVMASDLWEGALNAHPYTLSSLNGQRWKCNRRGSDSSAASAPGSHTSAKDSAKQIPLTLLLKNKFDLSHKMGTVLREKYSFNKLNGIREAYANAFARDFGSIKEALMDRCFDHLSEVRNVIVHKAGTVDQKLLDAISDCSAFDGLTLGHPLPFDGTTVSTLIKPCFKRSIDLIAAVDEWIWKQSGRTSNNHFP